MSCNDHHSDYHVNSNCVCDVAKFIHELQDCVSPTATGCVTGCDVPFLGANTRFNRLANTRVVSLTTKTGDLFTAPVTVTLPPTDPSVPPTTFCIFSPLFRVEHVDDKSCCAVLRVLTPPAVLLATLTPPIDPGDVICAFLTSDLSDLPNTGACITVDLNCFCAIQCLGDVHVSL